MPRWADSDDDWDDAEAQDDAEDFDPGDDADDELTIPCPYCHRQIHEDSPRCPFCEQYISREDSPVTRKPWWIVLGAVACLYVMYRWIVGG